MQVDHLWFNAHLVTLDPARGGLGAVPRGYIGSRNGRIACLGEGAPEGIEAALATDCAGRMVLPGLIDCHTHLVHGGNRAAEFEMRLAGASYEAIAAAGGGILSSVRATRAATEAELVATALPRLDALLAEGVTTVEIKSGYGLDGASETRLLRAARALGRARPVRVVTSFLGVHALPPEAEGDRDGYVDAMIALLPALAGEGLVDAVDAFAETIAFSPAQCDRLFAAAHRLGLPVKLHADQLSNGGGAALAAAAGALSADHLEHADAAGVAALAAAGTVAVLLPGAFYFLRESVKPPVALFRSHGVPMALATDCNPGTSPLTSLLLTMNMAATLFRMTVEECVAGVTRHAAQALGLGTEVGALAPGKRCDLSVWDAERPADLVYRMGFNPLFARVHGGVVDEVARPARPRSANI